MSAGNDREFIDFLQSKEKGGRSMKCPLRHGFDVSLFGKTGAITQDCLKEECAWWDDKVEMCGFLALEVSLKGILGYLGEIVSKMPHEEQFRR